MSATVEELYARLEQNPDDDDAFNGIRGAFLHAGDYQGWLGVIEARAARTQRADIKAVSFYEAGDISLGLGDPARAAQYYERALHEYPTYVDASLRLEQVLARENDFSGVVRVLENRAYVFAQNAFPKNETALLHLRAGEICRDQLGDRDRAVAHFHKAFELDPKLVPAIFGARQLYLEAQNARAAAALYDVEINAEQDPARKLVLLRELAELRGTTLGDLEGAIVALKRALSLKRDDVSTLHAFATKLLERAHKTSIEDAKAADLRRVAELYVEIAARLDAAERAVYLHAALDILPSFDSAIEGLMALPPKEDETPLLAGRLVSYLTHAEPSQPQALSARKLLADIYLGAGQFDHALACLEPIAHLPDADIRARISRAENARRAAVGVGPTELGEVHVSDAEADADAQELDAEDLESIEGSNLARMLASGQASVSESSTVLETAQKNAAPAQVDPEPGLRSALSEALLAGDSDQVRTAARALLEHKANDEEARAALARVLRSDRNWNDLLELLPHDFEALSERARELIVQGGHAHAVPLLERAIAVSSADAKRTRLLFELAAITEEILGRPGQAFEIVTRVLENDPHNLQALDAMERIDARLGQHERLLGTLAYRLEITPENERVSLLLRMAEIAERDVHDASRAAQWFMRAFVSDPSRLEALDRACAILRRSGNLRECGEMLRSVRGQLAPAARREVVRRLANLLREDLQNLPAAAEIWESEADALEDSDALETIRANATEKKDFAKLVEILPRILSRTSDPARKLDALRDLTQALRELGKAHEQAPFLRQILELSPSDELAWQKLIETLEAGGEFIPLAEALERRLEMLEEPEERAGIARKLANLYEHTLAVADKAIPALQAWADGDLSDPEPTRRLLPLLEKKERWRDLVSVLDTLAGVTDDEKEARAHVMRAAEVMSEKLADPNGAWERLEPVAMTGFEPALGALRSLAKSQARSREFAEICVRNAQNEVSAAEASPLWLEAASVFEKDLGDAPKALEATLRALALRLDDEKLLDEVDRLAKEARAWPRLAQVYDGLIKRSDRADRKIALHERHAKLLEDARDFDGALDRTLKAAALAPHPLAHYRKAARFALESNRMPAVLEHAERRKENLPPENDRIELLLEMARFAESAELDREKTRVWLEEALFIGNTNEESRSRVLRVVSELDAAKASPGNELRRAIASFEVRMAQAAPEASNARELWSHAASIFEQDLHDASAAFDVLKNAVVQFPRDAELLERLEESARKSGRLDECAAFLGEMADTEFDGRVVAQLLRRRALLLSVDLQRASDAADAWRRLTSILPGDPEASHQLLKALRDAERYPDLVAVLERQASRTTDKAKQVELLKEVASLWESTLGNPYEARAVWKRIARIRPNDANAESALGRLRLSRPPPPGALTASGEDVRTTLVPVGDESDSRTTEHLDPSLIERSRATSPHISLLRSEEHADQVTEEQPLEPAETMEMESSKVAAPADAKEVPSEPEEALAEPPGEADAARDPEDYMDVESNEFVLDELTAADVPKFDPLSREKTVTGEEESVSQDEPTKH